MRIWSILLVITVLIHRFKNCSAFTCSSFPSSRRQARSRLYFFRKEFPSDEPGVPYIIEPISRNPNDEIFRDISDMCINVFFKEQLNAKPDDRIAPWKEAQISYLKNLQMADLRRRRKLFPKTNEMFLAYEIVPVTSETTVLEKPLILDLSAVHNLPKNEEKETDYVRGELLGFCEVTQRSYGLGKSNEVVYDDEEEKPFRPILTNLAVKRNVRKYGIGSKLLDSCEKHVREKWKLDEIILEVEDYNTRAVNFYSNRNYDLVFEDPASRRFDVGGLVLRKVRCTRKVFRKVFSETKERSSDIITIDLNFFKRLRQTVGV